MGYSYNKAQVVAKIAASQKTQREVKKFANQEVNSAKAMMLAAFEADPVTKELEAGPTAPNDSETLNGVEGNLFSFIGFDKGKDPISPIRDVLEKETRLSDSYRVKVNQYAVKIQWDVLLPSKERLSAVAKESTPSWSDRSWIDLIEQGASGIRFFIYKYGIREDWLKKILEPIIDERSRSGTGLQIDILKFIHRSNKGGREGARFKNVSYISKILNIFKDKFR